MRLTTFAGAALLLLFVAASPIGAIAQYDMGTYSNYSGIRGTLLNPAAGADPKFKWDLNIASASVLYDNNFLYIPKGSVPAFGFHSIIKGIVHTDKFATYYDRTQPGKQYNVILAGELLGPSFQLGLPNGQSVGFHVANRISSNVRNIPGATAENAYAYLKDPTLWGREFSDQTTKVNGMNWLEYGVHYAAVLFDDGTNKWNAGITLKYLQGIAAAYAKNTHLSYKVQDSTDLLFAGSVDYGRTDYDSYRHIHDYGDLDHGHGFGVDVGLEFSHEDQYKIGLAVLDLGAINFNRNAAAYHLQTTGAAFPNWGRLELNSNEAVDRTLSAVFYNGDSSRSKVGNGFRMGLPTALSLHGDIHLQDHFFVNVAIVKGFGHGDNAGAVAPDIYSITPRYESEWWDISLPFSMLYYGIWRPRIGLAARVGYVFFGGDAPASLLALGRMTGTDFYAGVRFFVFKK
jgi:hypothetical protein